MAQLQIVCPLRSGTQERWRRLAQELAGSRREQFEACCQQVGITQIQVWVVQLQRIELLFVALHTQEPQQTLQALASSQSPFAHWLGEQLQGLLGCNLQEALADPPTDLLFTWQR